MALVPRWHHLLYQKLHRRACGIARRLGGTTQTWRTRFGGSLAQRSAQHSRDVIGDSWALRPLRKFKLRDPTQNPKTSLAPRLLGSCCTCIITVPLTSIPSIRLHQRDRIGTGSDFCFCASSTPSSYTTSWGKNPNRSKAFKGCLNAL